MGIVSRETFWLKRVAEMAKGGFARGGMAYHGGGAVLWKGWGGLEGAKNRGEVAEGGFVRGGMA